MVLLVAGSRHATFKEDAQKIYKKLPNPYIGKIQVIEGGCDGVDSIAKVWANNHNLSHRQFPADWSLGPKAGPIRNKEMAEYLAEKEEQGHKTYAYIFLKKGLENKGSNSMIQNLISLNLNFKVYFI